MNRTLDVEIELVVDAHAIIGEGPVWDADRGVLHWVDIAGLTYHQFDPNSGIDRTFKTDRYVGAVALRSAGGLVAAVHDGVAWLDPESGELELAVPIEDHLPRNRMNDGKCDPDGRFFAGTMGIDGEGTPGTLYRIDPDLRVRPIVSGVGISNGIDWSLDRRTMYFVDSARGGVDAFDFDVATGEVTNRRRFITIDLPGAVPDGMTVDSDGYLWVAMYDNGRVQRYSPSGDLDAAIAVPVEQVTCCAFGGADLKDLYVTTGSEGLGASARGTQPHAGGLFRCRPGPTGRPPNYFAG